MKAYNLKAQKVNMHFGVLSALVLGDHGEHKNHVIIPCEENIKDADYVYLGKTMKQNLRINFDKVQEEQNNSFYDSCWLARISTKGFEISQEFYNTGTIGLKPKSGVKVKAIGYDYKGRTAWYEYLLVVPYYNWIRVRESGLYDENECYWLYFDKHKVTRVRDMNLDKFLDDNPNANHPGFSDRYKDIVLNKTTYEVREKNSRYASQFVFTVYENRIPADNTNGHDYRNDNYGNDYDEEENDDDDDDVISQYVMYDDDDYEKN